MVPNLTELTIPSGRLTLTKGSQNSIYDVVTRTAPGSRDAPCPMGSELEGPDLAGGSRRCPEGVMLKPSTERQVTSTKCRGEGTAFQAEGTVSGNGGRRVGRV